MQKINDNKLVVRNKLLRYLSSSAELEYDAQGRVNVPLALREFADLSDAEPVMIVGTSDKVEIWNKTLWDKETSDDLVEDLRSLIDEVDL